MRLPRGETAKPIDSHGDSDALTVLSSCDEGPNLVLDYKYLLTLLGEKENELQRNPTDELGASQKPYANAQL